MKIEKLGIILIVVFANVFTNSYSQNPAEKFGDISMDELKNKICPIDSNAHAYYIFDFGNSYFQYADTKISSDDVNSSRKGFQLYFTRHYRIKVIDNQGFSWADIEIPLYRDGDKEKILNLKACTYNLENNKIVKTKLEKKDTYTEETNKYWITEKFAMPSVREGSIIEIEYTIKSDFYFNLREWYFQSMIPVLQSEYHVSIPEYYNFNQTQKGYFPIQREYDRKHKKISITYHQKAEGTAVKEQTYTNLYEYYEDIYHFYAKEIPAFPIEEHLRSEENYLSKFEFELQYTRFPEAKMKYYTTSWEDINQNLLDDDRFGLEINRTSHIKQDAEALKQLKQEEIILLNSAFSLIKNKLAWNGYKNIYPTTTLSKAYKEGNGNCADINLNLIILLRGLGFNAFPVILSTQENGVIHPAHPSISRFNYVIAMVKVENDTLLMDATDPASEIGLLPVRCLNDKGRIINNSNGDWISLMDYKPYSMIESYEVEITDDFELRGTNQVILKDYAAYLIKKEIKKHNNLDEYKSSLEKQTNGYRIHEIEVLGIDTIQDDMRMSLNFTQRNYAEQSHDIVFFSPVYQPFISENPFKLEILEYQFEFNYPVTIQQIYSIRIPGNLAISEVPKPLRARTPDGKMKYYYNIDQFDDKLTLSVMFSMSKTLFLPEEYQGLKAFYQMIVDKQKELIVLRKAQ
ncbi:MAG: DUF3857 domain-containing protein [Bacteroidales bacterium]|nr:DUF3857 domain-containing protein [Bacteroidales bacterium]